MSNVKQLKDTQLPDGFHLFIEWLVEEHYYEMDNILEVLEEPSEWQDMWELYHTVVVEPAAKAALEEAERKKQSWAWVQAQFNSYIRLQTPEGSNE